MSIMIQVLLAAMMTASGFLLTTAVQAESDLAAVPSVMPVFVAEINLGMPRLATAVVSPFADQQIIPEQFLGLGSLAPAGSLSWAGVDESAELMTAPMEERRDWKVQTAKTARAEEPDTEFLTAAPAPEPPTSVLAAVALVAGGVWTRARRCAV
jgi:hypothetical protein